MLSNRFLTNLKTGNFRLLAGKYGDIGIVILVLSAIAMMIIPLPAWLIDILITFNLSMAVVVLMSCLYLPDALKFSSFPSVLLITTLARLALNISTTRLILLHGDAGMVIQAFGDFVVSGSLIVGAIVFLILTIVQFVVIVKGSERIAEVAARFTLDAMPGKQLSIEADMRSGLVSREQARQQRLLLHRESQFYGSMDGAMRFAKGDAIASLVIISINFLGGLGVGIFDHGMATGEALRVFGLLTIGDGLVTQIPALIISISAGLLVTRVASETPGLHLGTEIGIQLFSKPRAIAITAFLLTGLAIVPGLPAIPFLIMAILCALVTLGLKGSNSAIDENVKVPSSAFRREPLRLEIGKELSGRLKDLSAVEEFNSMLQRIKTDSSKALGIPLPALIIRYFVENIPTNGYMLVVHETPMAVKCFEKSVFESGQTKVSILQILGEPFSLLMNIHSHRFLGVETIHYLLNGLEKHTPTLVREVIPGRMKLTQLKTLLTYLAEEGIPLINLEALLEKLTELPDNTKITAELAENLRDSLQGIISQQLTQGKGVLSAFHLEPFIEDTLSGSLQRNENGMELIMEPELIKEISAAIQQACADPGKTEQRPVIITRRDIRRHVWEISRYDIPHLAVVTYSELDPSLQIQSMGWINI